MVFASQLTMPIGGLPPASIDWLKFLFCFESGATVETLGPWRLRWLDAQKRTFLQRGAAIIHSGQKAPSLHRLHPTTRPTRFIFPA